MKMLIPALLVTDSVIADKLSYILESLSVSTINIFKWVIFSVCVNEGKFG